MVPQNYLKASRRFLGLVMIVMAVSGMIQPANASAVNLVWKPFLQQLTSSSVIISWTTSSGGSPTVRYAPDTSYSSSAVGTSRTLSALNTRLHRVQLTGLHANTRYHYRVYTDGNNLLSEQTLSFRTAPATGSTTPFSFVAFGDYGKNSDAQKRLRDQLLRDSFRFIVTTGDNAYASGTYSQFSSNVFDVYRNVFHRAAIFPSLGNHDLATGTGSPYLDLFDLPRNAWRSSDKERYYSFDYGNVHFVALDSNGSLNVSDSAATNDMLDWLRADLNRTTQPWKIVFLHHSAYSTGSHGSDSRVRSKLVPIFERYGVDVVLSGHDHIYQRSKPLRSGRVTTVEQGGIVYLVTGAGSAASYGCSSATWVATAVCSRSYGVYNRFTVSGNRIVIEGIRDTGEVKDRLTITQTDTTTNIPPEPVEVPPTDLPEDPNPVETPDPATDHSTYVWIPLALQQ